MRRNGCICLTKRTYICTYTHTNIHTQKVDKISSSLLFYSSTRLVHCYVNPSKYSFQCTFSCCCGCDCSCCCCCCCPTQFMIHNFSHADYLFVCALFSISIFFFSFVCIFLFILFSFIVCAMMFSCVHLSLLPHRCRHHMRVYQTKYVPAGG